METGAANVLLNPKKFVILQPVWNKYQKEQQKK